MSAKAWLLAGSGMVGVHSAWVVHTQNELSRAAAGRKFSPNSGDEVLKNGLATGDLILFSRRWERYLLPQALQVKMLQVVYGTIFDHVGVIVCDKYGVPHVFESSLFSGCKLRPFEDRVLHSRSFQIVVMPLLPRDVQHDESGKLAEYAARSVSQKSHYPPTSSNSFLRDCYGQMGISLEASEGALAKNIMDRSVRVTYSGTQELKFGPVVVVRTT